MNTKLKILLSAVGIAISSMASAVANITDEEVGYLSCPFYLEDPVDPSAGAVVQAVLARDKNDRFRLAAENFAMDCKAQGGTIELEGVSTDKHAEEIAIGCHLQSKQAYGRVFGFTQDGHMASGRLDGKTGGALRGCKVLEQVSFKDEMESWR